VTIPELLFPDAGEVKRYGFTGTESADDRDQELLEAIVSFLPEHSRAVVGCCIGVDAMAARASIKHGMFVHAVVPAPKKKIDPEWQAYCHTFEECPSHPGWTDSEEYMFRNQRLVDLSQVMIAVPKESYMVQRSGTWATVRRAQHAGIPVFIVPLLTDPDKVKDILFQQHRGQAQSALLGL